MFGLFEKKETCSICEKELTRKKISDGLICSSCIELCGNNLNSGNLSNTSISEVKEAIEKNKKDEIAIKNFKKTTKVSDLIFFDDEQKKFLIPKTLLTKARIYDYSEILSYEIQEDGETITKSGLGRAIVGGVLLGGVGAIVGSVS